MVERIHCARKKKSTEMGPINNQEYSLSTMHNFLALYYVHKSMRGKDISRVSSSVKVSLCIIGYSRLFIDLMPRVGNANPQFQLRIRIIKFLTVK